MPAIGFSKLNKENLAELIEEIKQRPDYQESAIDFEGNQFVELRYMVADNMGLVLRGVYNDNDEFEMDYYYPTYYGESISSEADVEIIKQSDRESYYVMCDDVNLGVNLIFYLQNMGEFLRKSNKTGKEEISGVKLAGLSCEGKILLPIYKEEKDKTKAKLQQQKRNTLVEAARDGVEAAIESLTLDDMETYSKISRRVSKEDILSIVTTFFMPYGIENDKYDILGEIVDCKNHINHITMEEIYVLTVNCNDIIFDICINAKGLLGEPAIGRRFKGNIWLQGTVDFI